MKTSKSSAPLILIVLTGSAFAFSSDHQTLRDSFNQSIRYTNQIEFPPRIGALGDPVSGQANFGIGADGVSQDPTGALFNGVSLIAGPITGNGRTCATCHLPDPGLHLGLPPLPLSSTVPLTDVLFTGLMADVGDDPLGFPVFDQLGLLLHRPNRLNPLFAEDSPTRQIFFWRKTTRLINTVFTFGLLNDGRMRELVETSRGAVFTHTQNGNLRFDDLVDKQRLRDISRFMEDQIDPPILSALLDPTDPRYQLLINDPFYSVNITTHDQRDGRDVFRSYCMDCHNLPNVFSNVDHVNNPPDSTPPPYGHAFDVGVAEKNALDLEFRRYDEATDTRVPIVLPLAAEDGTTVELTVVDDVGLAGATGRYEDLHKFKVPQLRRVAQLGPYFHDNSAATLEAVVDFFNSDDYNGSPDGRLHPIHLSARQRTALLAFLRIL